VLGNEAMWFPAHQLDELRTFIDDGSPPAPGQRCHPEAYDLPVQRVIERVDEPDGVVGDEVRAVVAVVEVVEEVGGLGRFIS